jgi:hypothetical protein
VPCDRRKYRWLAHECDRQRRAAGERLERDLFAAYQEEQEHARESRRERVERSREVVGGLVVGMSVTARVRGREREARIVKLGRSRVTVEFIIKSGAQRSAVLYACDVRAEDARKEAV